MSGTPVNPAELLVARPTVPALLAARAERTPSSVFLLWDGESWTYAEAQSEALRFSGWLEEAGSAGEGNRVAAFLGNRPEMIWAWFGTLAAGATFVPLNRAHRGAILADMIARSGARVLVTDREGLADLPDLSGTSVVTIVIADERQGETPPIGTRLAEWNEVRVATEAAPVAVQPDDLAELMYTSGTTGRSKAVRLSHSQICRGSGWVVHSLSMTESDVMHAWLPLFHIAGQVDTVMNSVIAGGTVALLPTFSLSRFWQQVEETKATICIGFANMAQLLCSLPPDPRDRSSTLRIGIGGAMPADLSVEFERRFGVLFHDCYGMTEAEPMILPPPDVEVPPGSCGRPSPDFEAAILDPEGNRLGPGEAGEICVRPKRRGVITTGYEGDDAATLEATRDLWFHTGDMGRVDEDGFVFFIDRIKHSIRKGGENISSWELENLVIAHPQVAECAAIGVASRLGGDEVKVAVVPADGEQLDPAVLHQWCKGEMASFMVPRFIEVLEALPRADTGKVMKEQLRQVTEQTWDAGERG